jgi:O-methyltransferase
MVLDSALSLWRMDDMNGLKELVRRLLLRNGCVACHVDKHASDVIQDTKRRTSLLLGDLEAHILFSVFQTVSRIDGDVAEVGVYKGGSARILCILKGNKRLHLFDTFEGLPDTDEIDRSRSDFHRGNYRATLDEVQENIRGFEQVFLYKGLFPKTAEPIRDAKFAFVHLDVDLFRSTKDCLEFFYPRMTAGGVILSHDYGGSQGVKAAFDGFFKSRRESVFSFPGSSQCMVIRDSEVRRAAA